MVVLETPLKENTQLQTGDTVSVPKLNVLLASRRCLINSAQTICNWVYPDTYDAIKKLNNYLESEHCRRGKPVAGVAPLLPASRKQFAAGYPDTYDVTKEFNIYLECGHCRRQHRGKTFAEVATLLPQNSQ